MPLRHMIHRLAAAALAFFAASCSPPHVYKAYDGPTLSPADIATLEGDNPSIQGLEGSGSTIYIASIDGNTALSDWKAPAVVVQVKPGEHSIGLAYRERSQPDDLVPELMQQQLLSAIDQSHRQTIRFSVEGGARYVIYVDREAGRYGVRKAGGGEIPVTVVGTP